MEISIQCVEQTAYHHRHRIIFNLNIQYVSGLG